MSTNAYVETNIVAGKITAAAQGLGSKERKILVTYEKTASDTSASILRFVKGLSPDDIISNVLIANDALAGCTSVAVGFYGVLDYDNVGAIVGSGNQLAAALDLSSAHASGSELSAISSVDQADRVKRIYELCGHTQATKLPAYDLCLTLTTGGSATGTITLLITIAQG
jgi:hypothetical protein